MGRSFLGCLCKDCIENRSNYPHREEAMGMPPGASVSPPNVTPASTGPEPHPVRTFDTGATRDTDDHKLDYEAFLSPLALERYARYMDKHRVQKDGTLREGCNWQKGIPLEAYAKSEWRHHMEFWSLHRGYGDGDIEEAICAALFNLFGYLHETLRAKL